MKEKDIWDLSNDSITELTMNIVATISTFVQNHGVSSIDTTDIIALLAMLISTITLNM